MPLLRDDLYFWRAHTRNETQALIKQAVAAAMVMDYRQAMVVEKRCIPAAKLHLAESF